MRRGIIGRFLENCKQKNLFYSDHHYTKLIEIALINNKQEKYAAQVIEDLIFKKKQEDGKKSLKMFRICEYVFTYLESKYNIENICSFVHNKTVEAVEQVI